MPIKNYNNENTDVGRSWVPQRTPTHHFTSCHPAVERMLITIYLLCQIWLELGYYYCCQLYFCPSVSLICLYFSILSHLTSTRHDCTIYIVNYVFGYLSLSDMSILFNPVTSDQLLLMLSIVFLSVYPSIWSIYTFPSCHIWPVLCFNFKVVNSVSVYTHLSIWSVYPYLSCHIWPAPGYH